MRTYNISIYLSVKSFCLDEVDLEDLMAQMTPAEVQALVDEMAADPDDVHIPASVRLEL